MISKKRRKKSNRKTAKPWQRTILILLKSRKRWFNLRKFSMFAQIPKKVAKTLSWASSLYSWLRNKRISRFINFWIFLFWLHIRNSNHLLFEKGGGYVYSRDYVYCFCQSEKLSEIKQGGPWIKPPLALRRLLVETGYKYFLFFVSFIINIPDMISCPKHAIRWHNSCKFLLVCMYVLYNW